MNELSLEFPFSVLEEDWIVAEAVGRPLLSLIGLKHVKINTHLGKSLDICMTLMFNHIFSPLNFKLTAES